MQRMEHQTNDYALVEQDNICVVRLRLPNLLNIVDVNRIGDQLNGIIDRGARRLVLDLKKTSYLGSAALGMLLALSKKVRDTNGRMIISHPEHLLPLLKVSRTERLFELAVDPREAMDRMRV